MLLVLFSGISGIISGLISLFFRLSEIQNKSLYFGRQLIIQILFFFLCIEIGALFFRFYEFGVGIVTLSWIWVFFIINTIAYYLVKILFESYTNISFYASDKEVAKIIKQLEKKYRDEQQ